MGASEWPVGGSLSSMRRLGDAPVRRGRSQSAWGLPSSGKSLSPRNRAVSPTTGSGGIEAGGLRLGAHTLALPDPGATQLPPPDQVVDVVAAWVA